MGMKCKQVWRILPVYVIGHLAPAKAATVRQHLDGCEGCAKEEAALRRVLELTAEMPLYRSIREGERPAKVTLSQAAAVERFIQERHGVSPAWRTAAAVFCVAALALAFAQARDMAGQRSSLAGRSLAGVEMPHSLQVAGGPTSTAPEVGATTVAAQSETAPKVTPATKRGVRAHPVSKRPRGVVQKPGASPKEEAPPAAAVEGVSPPPPEQQSERAATESVLTYYVCPPGVAASSSGNEVYPIREVPAWAWLYPPTRFNL